MPQQIIEEKMKEIEDCQERNVPMLHVIHKALIEVHKAGFDEAVDYLISVMKSVPPPPLK